LKKIGAVIDTAKGVILYIGKEEKLNYNNGNLFNQHSSTEENTTIPLKEFILKKERKLTSASRSFYTFAVIIVKFKKQKMIFPTV